MQSDLSERMLNVIVFFTHAENLVGHIFVKIAGPDARKLIDDFVQRPSSPMYANRLLAMAAPRIPAEDMLSLRALMRMFLDCYEERNVFAHWICGIATAVPQGLLMIDPHDLWQRQVTFHAQLYESPPPKHYQSASMLLVNDEVWVYEKQHFDKIDEKISALIKALGVMYSIHAIVDERARSQLRAHLSAMPQFQKARASLPAEADPKKTKSLQRRFARLRHQLRRAFREFFGKDYS